MGISDFGEQSKDNRKIISYGTVNANLIHGDCLDILRSMSPQSADCIFIDPPFNAGKEYQNSINDNRNIYEYRAWLSERLIECNRVLKTGGMFWLMQSQEHVGYCQAELERIGLTFCNIIAWAYTNPTPLSNSFPHTWRPILLFSKGVPKSFNWHWDIMAKPTLYFNPGRAKNIVYPHDLWPDIPKLVGGYLAQDELLIDANGRFAHLAQMPLRIAERAILTSTKIGDIILDPFMGSGTVGCAASKWKRHYIGMEISRVYYELSVKRLEDFAAQPELPFDSIGEDIHSISFDNFV